MPVHDDRLLFEFLVLEGAQAGLSWLTILRKRQRYREVFARFEPSRVAGFSPADEARLRQDTGIVRNRLKIASAITNARAFLAVQATFGSFDRFLWDFVDGVPVQNHWRDLAEMPTETATSQRLSRELRRRGFGFVGSTICYAYMQAVGLVNDHLVTCYRHGELGAG